MPIYVCAKPISDNYIFYGYYYSSENSNEIIVEKYNNKYIIQFHNGSMYIEHIIYCHKGRRKNKGIFRL